MTNPVFFCLRHLGKGAVEARRLKNWIVTEAITTADLLGDLSFAHPMKKVFLALEDQRHYSPKAGGTRRFAPHLPQGLGDVIGGGGVGTREAGGGYSGCSVEGVDLQPGIFRKAIVTVSLVEVPCFQERISRQGIGGFGDVFGNPEFAHTDDFIIRPGEQFPNLAYLIRVTRSKYQSNHIFFKLFGRKESRIFPPLKPPTMKKIFLLLTLFLAWMGCKTTQINDPDVLIPMVELDRGTCFGQCPSFSMTIYTNGLIKFNGRKFTAKEGFHERTISQNEVESLRKLLEDAKLWQYQDEYDRGISDVQTIRLKYYDEDYRTKSIRMRGVTEEESLNTLVSYLTEMSTTGTWAPIQSNSSISTKTDDEIPEYVISNELIVKLKPDAQPEALTRRFASEGMQLDRPVSAPMHIYLYTFRADQTDPREMLQRVRAADGVVEAEFNKRLGGRS